MPTYFYIAKSFDGKSVTGNMAAQDEREIAQALKSQGLMLIRAVPEEKKKKSLMSLSFSLGGVSATEKIMMTRNLGVMFSTGLSLVKSMDILSAQAKNKNLKNALLDIKDRINKGENFSDALSKYPKIFSDLFCSMIKVGEESGTLEEVLSVLAAQLVKEHELKSKIKNAMIYPCIVLMVMVLVGIVIVVFVLPSLSVFFTSLSVDVPIYTKILLAVGAFMSERWYIVLLGLVAFVGAGWMFLKTKRGKHSADTFLLRLPIISSIVKKSNSAAMVRSLSSLITAGVSITRALEITSQTMSNTYFKKAATEASGRIKNGEKLSAALKVNYGLFPVGVIEMVEVGEETGKTSVIFKKLADFYEQEAISAVEKLTLIIEPALIIVLGLGVGVFAFSIIGPMYSSLKSINM